MESRLLNMAHQQHRRAEVHLQNNRFDEAIQCHHNAAELLLGAMKSTTSSVALESITLQHSYHLKQKDFIKIKKAQYERVAKAMDHLKLLGKDAKLNLQVTDTEYIQISILKTINEADSLLSNLRNKNNNQDPVESNTVDAKPVESNPVESNSVEPNSVEPNSVEPNSVEPNSVEPNSVEPNPVESTLVVSNESNEKVEVIVKKTEKSQETFVEELQVLNNNVRYLVERLVLQVEVLKDENMTLKDKVNYLEKERTKYLSFNIPLYDDDDGLQSHFSSGDIEGDQLMQKVPIVQEPQQSRPVNAVDRTGQPHFDLTALKTSTNSL